MKQRKRNKVIQRLLKCATDSDGFTYEPAIVAINEFIDMMGDVDQYEFDCIKGLILSCYCAGLHSSVRHMERKDV